MFILLILIILVGLALSSPLDPELHVNSEHESLNPEPYYYFDRIGIPLATLIYKAEQELLKNNGDKLNQRIIGGRVNPLGASPYLGGIDVQLTTRRRGVCGSSLLSHSRSLTAAHCWFDGRNQAAKYTLIHGSATFYYNGTRTETSDVTMHEQYDWRRARNDIAIIRHSNITFTDVISPIDLPSGDMLNNKFEDVWAQAVGYGKNGTDSPMIRDQPQRIVDLQVMRNEDCKQVFPATVTDSILCTRDGPPGAEVGTCSGDSGGPLSTVIDSKRYLIGVVSTGNEFCERQPAIFSRVTSFVDWINARM